ncbi:MAG: Omp28-related outer membrane protein [Chlorobi bacterium]|nr:Omp28-related outer membrane protein [Chlorobiota bacterium]
MKKLLTFLALALTLSFVCQTNAQDLVSTDPQPRNSILEEYTGIYCGWCPEGHIIANQLMADNPGRFIAINVHAGGYAIPQAGSGHPDFRTPYGEALISLAQVAGFPMGSVNRQIFKGTATSMSRGDWETYAEQVMAEISPVNIGAEATWISSKSIKIEVELYFTDAAPANNLLNVALLESGVIGYQGGSKGGEEYEHNHILRSMSSQWGETIEESSKGTLVKRTIIMTVPETVNPKTSDIDIVVFLTQENKQHIYTGISIGLSNDLPGSPVEITGVTGTTHVRHPGESLVSIIILKNNSDTEQTIALDIQKSEEMPEDWFVAILSHQEEIVNIPAGAEVKVKYSVTAGATTGYGTVIVDIAHLVGDGKESNYFEKTIVSSEFVRVMINTSTVGAVIPEGTMPTLPVQIFEQVVSRLAKLQVIVWDNGNNGSFNESNAVLIKNAIAAGINVVLIGNSTVIPLGLAGTLESIGISYIGQCLTGYDAQESRYVNFNVTGIPDDIISSEIGNRITCELVYDFISIFSAEDDNTTAGIIRFLDDGKYRILGHDGKYTEYDMKAEDSFFGFRYDNGDQRVVYLSEAPSIFLTKHRATTFIEKIIEYINGLVSVEDFDAYFNNMTAAPNPFTNTTTIEFNMSSAAVADLSIVDVQGNLVKDLGSKTLLAGSNIEIIDSYNLASGLYFFVVKTASQTQQIKLLINK